VFLGTPILSDIPLYSPFIKSVKVSGLAASGRPELNI